MPNQERGEIIAELVIDTFRGSLKSPSETEMAAVVKTWRKRLDEKQIPDEDLKPLYAYALQVKNDMTNFSIGHIIRAWPDYVSLFKTDRKQTKEECPFCKGTGFRKIFNVSSMTDEKVKCWKNHE